MAQHQFKRLRGNDVEDLQNDDKIDATFLNRRVYPRVYPFPGFGCKSSSHPIWGIIEKIRSAFSNVTSFPLKGIIFQFWVPVRLTTGRLLLSCKAYPYAIVPLNRRHQRYRSSSGKFRYSIDDMNKVEVEENNGDSKATISGGLPARAYLNQFPEVVLDLKAHQGKGNPLVDLALECDFTCSVMLPVFSPSFSSPVGVVECSSKVVGLLVIFNELKRALKGEGLNIYRLQGSWPYKARSIGLKAATDEILRALHMACEAHDLTFGQVWIPYESESHHNVPCSSSSIEERKQMFLVKLTSCGVYSTEDPLSSSILDFYDNCDVLPLKTGEGLAWKTLETSQPHFCRNIYKLNNDDEGGVLAILSANAKCSRLVICLRSAYREGDNFDYVFEFFWAQSRDYFILLECLLVNLKKWLPNFKFASGAQLGDEFCVFDVKRSGIKSFKLLQGNKISQTCEALKVPSVKRKEDDDDGDDDDDVVMVVHHQHVWTVILLPKHSSTLENALKKIKQELGLDENHACNLKYEVDDGKWVSINGGDEASFKVCLEYGRKTGKSHIKLALW